jgi:hypothetical protein
MQKSLPPIIAGCLAVAALVFSAPKPASATIAAPALHYGEAEASIVQQVRRYWRGHRYGWRGRGYYPYAYGYGYRPYGYYQPYGYYRPYGYYGGYGYRPGVNLWFGF